MNQQPAQSEPTLPIGMNDLEALRSIIRGYLAYMQRASPPSEVRQQQMRLLEGVYQRLVQIPRGTMAARIPLSFHEIYALNSAMLGFAAFVRQKVAPSRDRDETLQSLEALRQAVVSMISSRH